MTEEDSKFTRRRVLGGLITVGAASAAAGAGTFALFSDTETSSGNSVTAGTLNLVLNDGGATTTIGLQKAKPGDSGHVAIAMENTGNVSGQITGVNIGDVSSGSFSNALVTDSDGTSTDFESSPGTDGELDNHLEVGVFIETNSDFGGSPGTGSSTISRSGNETNIVSSGTTLSSALGESTMTKSLSGTKVLVINYEIPSGVGNTIQGDQVVFDVQVTFEQA